MRHIIETGCRIEDRRAPSSVDKPSVIVEHTCTDCGQVFLTILASPDASDYTPCCWPCRGMRRVLTICRPGPHNDSQTPLEPNEDPVEVLQGSKRGTYAYLRSSPGGDVERRWERRDGVWVEMGV